MNVEERENTQEHDMDGLLDAHDEDMGGLLDSEESE